MKIHGRKGLFGSSLLISMSTMLITKEEDSEVKEVLDSPTPLHFYPKAGKD